MGAEATASTQEEVPNVAVGVADDTSVKVEVAVAVGVAVGEEVAVKLGVKEAVPLGVEEAVAVMTSEGETEGDSSVFVLVGVKIVVTVFVGEGVLEGTARVAVGVGVRVFVKTEVGDGVSEGGTIATVGVGEGLGAPTVGVPTAAVGEPVEELVAMGLAIIVGVVLGVWGVAEVVQISAGLPGRSGAVGVLKVFSQPPITIKQADNPAIQMPKTFNSFPISEALHKKTAK